LKYRYKEFAKNKGVLISGKNESFQVGKSVVNERTFPPESYVKEPLYELPTNGPERSVIVNVSVVSANTKTVGTITNESKTVRMRIDLLMSSP